MNYFVKANDKLGEMERYVKDSSSSWHGMVALYCVTTLVYALLAIAQEIKDRP